MRTQDRARQSRQAARACRRPDSAGASLRGRREPVDVAARATARLVHAGPGRAREADRRAASAHVTPSPAPSPDRSPKSRSMNPRDETAAIDVQTADACQASRFETPGSCAAAMCVGADPAGRGVIGSARRVATATAAAWRRVALAGGAEGHVHRLLDEVAFVGGRALDEFQTPQERFIAGVFVVHGEAPEEGEGRALLELLVAAGHSATLAQACGVWSKRWKQTVSTMAQLSKSRHQRSICAGVTCSGSSTCREHPGLVPRRCPTVPRRGRGPARARLPSSLSPHRHAERLVRRDRVPRHAVADGLGADPLQRRQRRLGRARRATPRSSLPGEVSPPRAVWPSPLVSSRPDSTRGTLSARYAPRNEDRTRCDDRMTGSGAHGAPARERRGAWDPRERPSRGPGRSTGLV